MTGDLLVGNTGRKFCCRSFRCFSITNWDGKDSFLDITLKLEIKNSKIKRSMQPMMASIPKIVHSKSSARKIFVQKPMNSSTSVKRCLKLLTSRAAVLTLSGCADHLLCKKYFEAH
ncbi:hypothetical protein AVEN_171529-1 [Araneus ventricosus]|uniref:Uncharacterized protein n=1 Tax=Araneus ventricosus TaxID=182803 RepID=A0A4Y2MC98_ARAVE|nr:hypothetical protein AVEN_171529-1 [Araneus ventricosus]